MADSIDRVFVHALNTVKKIPKTGATRPPARDRMRLYGLYKQAMEGDVDGVMERPTPTSMSNASADDVVREQDKWDAWAVQKGLSRTEAKRRYIEALIETMHRYANTPTALELVGELEFVWGQVRSNSGSEGSEGRRESQSRGRSSETGSGESHQGGGIVRKFQAPVSGTDGPMKVLSPMSEQDESEKRMGEEDGEGEESQGEYVKKGDKRTKRMERAIVRLSAEIAALREQIATGREWRAKKEKSVGAWAGWVFWLVVKHVTVDVVILLFVLLWMRRRRDRRFEDHVRGALGVMREYVRKVLPSR
ncbi:acyl CoA binding protein-domain-containing protein [Immersiella caudata]|uniref:Acyl CoA binding protein-domain-containing protein n=1 Tax=Immersiella caudata TaxID=314043 RepID=A0AA40C6L3_9PEZI|nr:acyl CoA binding protein-domain-containing protein [Immersiella caudata]